MRSFACSLSLILASKDSGERLASAVTICLSARQGVARVEFEIQLENVHTGFAQQAEGSSFSMPADNLPHLSFIQPAFASHARDLEFSRRRRDMRIESRGRSGDEINRQGGAGILLL